MADPDGLMSAPPGVDRDAGSDNTISGTVDGAVASAMAHIAELESDTLHPGTTLGDALPLTGLIFSDTTELQGEPGVGPNVPATAPHQGGSYSGNLTDSPGS